MCTNAVQYVIREDQLHAIVQMRSNDGFYGYRNDYAWQKNVLDTLSQALQISPGLIHWNAGSLHIYEKDFWMVEAFRETLRDDITKKEYLGS
jgi:thymidylate synthase